MKNLQFLYEKGSRKDVDARSEEDTVAQVERIKKRFREILNNPNSSKEDITHAKAYFKRPDPEPPHDPTVVEDGITPFEGFLADRIMEIFNK